MKSVAYGSRLPDGSRPVFWLVDGQWKDVGRLMPGFGEWMVHHAIDDLIYARIMEWKRNR